MPTSKEITTAPPPEFEPVILDFECLVTDITDVTKTREGSDRAQEFIVFHCAELEIHEAKEPYTLPVYQLEERLINIPGSRWAALTASIEKCGYKGDINGLINKRLHFKWSEVMLNQTKRTVDEAGNTTLIRGQYEMRPGHCWQVVEIEGVENTSNKLGEEVLALADGKTAVEFQSAFFSATQLTSLTGYQDVAQQVIDRNFLDTMVQAGQLTVDESGIYHKVNNG